VMTKWHTTFWRTVFLVMLCGCSKQQRSRLPPPVYGEPSLPAWESPAQPDAPFDLEGMEGESVIDDEDVASEGDPEPEESHQPPESSEAE
jgi:hypothetical protein